MSTIQPGPQGLYDPAYEHDACGVGFVVDLKNRKSHDIVHKAVTILNNLEHRGACGCEENTGDGAGILIQMPHRFLLQEAFKLVLELPEEGEYGVGMVFLPQDPAARARCERMFEKIVRDEGQQLIGWRTVPTNNQPIGPTAQRGEPVIRQIFIRKISGLPADRPDDPLGFERKLYVIRRLAEKAAQHSSIPQKEMFYISSLSARTLIYKGMLNSPQVES